MNFNIEQIADSGQCFRMNPVDKNTYGLVAYGKYIELTQIDFDTVKISCSEEEYETIWHDYFDMDYDYEKVLEVLLNGEDQFLKDAGNFGRGLRILAQEPFEILISFIISQNKNIPGIKSSIEALSEKFGDKKICGSITYHTFPTPERLANAELVQLKETRLGYRDKYVLNAAKAVVSKELDLNALKAMKHEEAYKELKNIYGVGTKVANCIALYGLHHIDMVPIDVWMARIVKEIYNNQFDWKKYQDFAGIVQQYMFYYMRYGYRS